MAKAEYYPPADHAVQNFASRYPGDRMDVNTLVWHTTEGGGWPDYSGGSMAPTLTVMPSFSHKRLHFRQHFPFDMSARALVHAGSVATNTLNVAQVELIGTCDPAAKWPTGTDVRWWDPPQWCIDQLGDFVAWCRSEHGVPLKPVDLWLPYPASYGSSRARMSEQAWSNFSGHCGHAHVPSGNVHGDPGALPIRRILAAAVGSHDVPGPPPNPTPGPTTPPAPRSGKAQPLASLSLGDHGPLVALAKHLLNATTYGAGVDTSDRFGQSTADAVQRMKTDHPRGAVDPSTDVLGTAGWALLAKLATAKGA